MKEKLKAINERELLFENDVFNVVVKKSNEKTTIFLYGNIDFIQPDYDKLKTTLTNTLKENESVTIRINSYGGSIIDGMIIYDIITSFSTKITTVIDGFASGFVLPVAMSGNEIFMTENSFLNLESIIFFVDYAKDVLVFKDEKLEVAQYKLSKVFKNKVRADYYNKVRKFINTSGTLYLEAEKCKEINLCDSVLKPVNNINYQKDETVVVMVLHPDEVINVKIKASDYLEDQLEWTFQKWQNEDPKGLEMLAFRFPQTFKKLYHSHYYKK